MTAKPLECLEQRKVTCSRGLSGKGEARPLISAVWECPSHKYRLGVECEVLRGSSCGTQNNVRAVLQPPGESERG